MHASALYWYNIKESDDMLVCIIVSLTRPWQCLYCNHTFTLQSRVMIQIPLLKLDNKHFFPIEACLAAVDALRTSSAAASKRERNRKLSADKENFSYFH